jgi:hypothetical protein
MIFRRGSLGIRAGFRPRGFCFHLRHFQNLVEHAVSIRVLGELNLGSGGFHVKLKIWSDRHYEAK